MRPLESRQLLPPLFYPSLITQGRIGVPLDHLNARLSGAISFGFAVQGNFDFAIETIVEQRPILVTAHYRFATDGDQVITNLSPSPSPYRLVHFRKHTPRDDDLRPYRVRDRSRGLPVDTPPPPGPRGGAPAPVCEAFSSPIISLMMFSSSCRSPTSLTSQVRTSLWQRPSQCHAWPDRKSGTSWCARHRQTSRPTRPAD